MSIFDFMKNEMDTAKEQDLFRSLKTIEHRKGSIIKVKGKPLINFCSNDYLGLSNHPQIIKKTAEVLKRYGIGSGASRLVSGNFDLHEELEAKISEFEGTESTIVFPTGYMANVGTIQALVGAGDGVIVDRLNHASIIDGARLSGAKLLVYSHNDVKSLEKVLIKAKALKKKLIITDHIFSMDGDIAPVKEIVELAHKYNAMLMLDTAHSTGVLPFDLPKDKKANVIIMGTLSKAVGALGGFVSGKSELIDYLRNKARAFIYTTGLPPAIAAASIASFEIIKKDKGLKKDLWNNVKYIKEKLKDLKFNTLGSETQIIPILVGEALTAMEISNYLFSKGIFLSAMRPPTVPKGTSRLRLTITAKHERKDLDYLVEALKEVKEKYF